MTRKRRKVPFFELKIEGKVSDVPELWKTLVALTEKLQAEDEEYWKALDEEYEDRE